MGNLEKFSCPACGAELKDQGNGLYKCKGCAETWKEKEVQNFSIYFKNFEQQLENLTTAIDNKEQKRISNLKRSLWKQVNAEFVSNKEVERLCKGLLAFSDEDFYANFFLATCVKNKNEFGKFLSSIDAAAHFDDIPLILDYLLKALKPEWSMDVGNFIEKVKDIDTALYHKYRTRFEEEYVKIEECIFEPAFPRDVFIAYSSTDMVKVSELVAELEEAQLTCFVAARNMRHGSGSVENYEKVIQTAIDYCTVVVFVSSDNSRSNKCDAYRELGYIGEHCKDMPRIEYLIKNYSGRAAEPFFEKFFDGCEYCLTAKDVAVRVNNAIMEGAKKPKKQQNEPETSDVKARELLLKKAKRLSVEGKYAEAKALYSQLKESDSEDIDAYIGLVRVASQNFHIYEGGEIEESIRIAQDMFGKKLNGNVEYRQYIRARVKYIKNSELEQGRQSRTASKPPREKKGKKAKKEKRDSNSGSNKRKLFSKNTIILMVILAIAIAAGLAASVYFVKAEHGVDCVVLFSVAAVQFITCVVHFSTRKGNSFSRFCTFLMGFLLIGSVVLTAILATINIDYSALCGFILMGTGAPATLYSVIIFLNDEDYRVENPNTDSIKLVFPVGAFDTIMGLILLLCFA